MRLIVHECTTVLPHPLVLKLCFEGEKPELSPSTVAHYAGALMKECHELKFKDTGGIVPLLIPTEYLDTFGIFIEHFLSALNEYDLLGQVYFMHGTEFPLPDLGNFEFADFAVVLDHDCQNPRAKLSPIAQQHILFTSAYYAMNPCYEMSAFTQVYVRAGRTQWAPYAGFMPAPRGFLTSQKHFTIK